MANHTDSEPQALEAPTFDVLPLGADVRRAVDELGFTQPTPVQQAVYEPACAGRDLVVQARTGTGKTASFGLPLIDKLVRKVNEPQALVLCPTRELALQIHRELEALGKYKGIRTVAVYGGAPMPAQVEALARGPQIVAGTPGRVLDHLRRRTLDPSKLRVLVLDESDEMLSMGFLPQITDILSFLPEERQTLLFSATLPPDIQRMAERRMRTPEFITLSGDHVGALAIQHYVYHSTGDKLGNLAQIIEVENPESAIVFCNTRDDTRKVAAALQSRGYQADWLNADLAQSDREKVMAATRKGALRFLVATDVAARGIDISHLTHVINYGLPESAENYVHRTGRTGRAGRTGTAITLLDPSDIGALYLLRLTYKIRPLEKQLPSAQELKTRAEADVLGMLAELFTKRPPHRSELALARRLLTHDAAVTIVAGLLGEHLGEHPETAEQAAQQRRAQAPRPASAPAEVALAAPVAPAPTPAALAAPSPAASPAVSPAPPASPSGEPAPRRGARRPSAEERPSPARSPRAATRATPPTPPEEHDLPRFTIEDAPAGAAPPKPALDPDVAEVFVNVGRRDGAREQDFLAKLHSIPDTRFINVKLRHSFIGVATGSLERAIAALDGATIAGRVAAASVARPRGDDG